MKILQKVITLVCASAVLSFNSCDSGGGNEAEALEAPASLVGSTLKLIPDGGPLAPLCGLSFRELDFRAGTTLNEDGSALIVDELSYTYEDNRGRILIQFNVGKIYLIRLNFTTSKSGSFTLFDVSAGETCSVEGAFTLLKTSPAAGMGIELAP